MRILITGATGQLGEELQRLLPSLGEVVAAGRELVDLEQPDRLPAVVQGLAPDLIVNAAAYTAVDKAESDAERAELINAIAPGVLAIAARQLGIGLIHVSTDYVFDGSQSHPYQETDATHPLGVYGGSKLRGEVAVRNHCDHYCILRTAWVYGARGKGNFVKTMLRLGAEREEIRVVADQVGSPTWSYHLATAIAQLIPHFSRDLAGTYQFTNSGVASWYDFAVAIFEEAAVLGFPLKLQRVIPITTAEYPTPARRPAYSVLSCAKISAVLGTYPPHWRLGLRQMLQDLKAPS
ncbi:dTDP-4-dehydrorhamnose reductase [Neosynechococcus sphagnicola sy1]|uniref:dTDP-4-dehydrorhamnose reductase n=2 Tax=Neosynechococcus TaxID=1501143 RepID=A0A098TIY4_9CYAN|nr:dTDP-4-dehydrorhamnose reductase [Neosynechococcus sphagnicola sy1]